MKKLLMPLLVAATWSSATLAGPFAPAAGQPGSTAVARTDSQLVAWATAFSNYQPGTDLDAAFADASKALGPAEGTNFDAVSLGNGGRITLSFAGTLFNGAGYDFAVFENSFSDTFLELAFVEVSSDGANFFRFPNFSFTPAAVGAFGAIDPTNVEGYAGKYRMGFGTPFDLDVLKNAPGLNVNAVSHIRLVDVLGNGSEFDNYPAGAPFNGPHAIFDPFRTIGSAGFDLDGIGARHFTAAPPAPVPLPGALGLFALAGAGLLRRLRRA
jgi:hypothetical protein